MTPILVRLVVLIGIFVSVFLVSQLIAQGTLGRRGQRKAVNRRLRLLESSRTADQVNDLLRRRLPILSEQPKLWDKLAYRYQRMVFVADLKFDPRMIALVCLLAFAALVSLILFVSFSAGFKLTAGVVELVIGVAASATLVLPLMVVGRMAQRRRKKMEEQFLIALDVFTRALRAGHPVSAAIDLLTKEIPDPAGTEFGIVADEVAYGANLQDALLGLADRWDIADIRMFVTSISVQSETGGNLAELLESLSRIIRDRASLYMKVRALSSEGRMSAWMLTALPIFTLLSMFALNSSFYLDVATDPLFVYGFTALIALYLVGVFTIRRMIDLRV